MSADNWAMCPRCAAKREAELRTEEDRVQAAYGSVAVGEFDAMRETLASKRAERVEATFREEYEFFGAEEGVVVAAYSGSCRICGLAMKFRDEHPLPVIPVRVSAP